MLPDAALRRQMSPLKPLHAAGSLARDPDDAAPVAEQLSDAGDLFRVDALHERLHHLEVGEGERTKRLEVARVLTILTLHDRLHHRLHGHNGGVA